MKALPTKAPPTKAPPGTPRPAWADHIPVPGATPTGQGLTPSPFQTNQETISSIERAAEDFDNFLRNASSQLPPVPDFPTFPKERQ